MISSSVLALTGQTWKLVLGIAALLVGSFAPLFSASGLDWTTGTVLAVAGYVFVCFTVRCPNCGSRWFWQAALDAGLYGHIFGQGQCPACKYDYAKAPAQGS